MTWEQIRLREKQRQDNASAPTRGRTQVTSSCVLLMRCSATRNHRPHPVAKSRQPDHPYVDQQKDESHLHLAAATDRIGSRFTLHNIVSSEEHILATHNR